MRALTTIVILLAGCGGPPLGGTCYDIRAPDTVIVSFNGEWDPGTYEIELAAGGPTAMCVISLPTGDDPFYCSDNVIELDLSDAEDAVTGMRVWDFAPDGFEIEMTFDGQQIAEREFTPEYELDEPNGAGCGERRTGTVEMTF